MARLLIVDDDLLTRRFLRDVLEKLLRHTVEEASSVAAALERAGTTQFDLVFLDQNLPDGTALDLCQALSQLQPHLLTPKWLITGEKPLVWDTKVWTHFGVQGYLVKPFRIHAITDVLNRCLAPSSV